MESYKQPSVFPTSMYQLMAALHLRGWTETSPEAMRGSIESYHFESNTQFVVSGVKSHLRLRLSKERLDSIFKAAINGDLKAMNIVSLMYASDFGLPLNELYAMDWALLSSMSQPEAHGYEELIGSLKQDRKSLYASQQGDYVKPTAIVRIERMIARAASMSKQEEYVDGYKLPIIGGKRIAAVYRASSNIPQLCAVYDVTAGTVNFDEALWAAFSIPENFGDIRGRNTLQTYNSFKGERYYVVLGVIATPKTALEDRRNYYPDKSVNDLYAMALANDRTRVRPEDVAKELEALARTQMDKAKAIKAQSNPSKKRYAECRELASKYKRASENKAYLRKKAAERDAPYQLSNYLEFVAVELFYIRGSLRPTPISASCVELQHLQSLGFTTVLHEAETLNSVKRNLSPKIANTHLLSIVERLNAKSRFTVRGYYVRESAKTVNKAYYVLA